MGLLRVACAIIEHDNHILVVQRSAGMKNGLLWEFPGGKLESGEAAIDCIVREIKEELGIKVHAHQQLSKHDHENIQLIPFVCSWKSGNIQLYEHKEARWLPAHELLSLHWCPADIPVVKMYLKSLIDR